MSIPLHLGEQTTAATVGKQKALEKQGSELLAGQCPALYPVHDVWPRDLQGLCLWVRASCGGWEGQCSCYGDWERPWCHRVRVGQLTQVPVLQG